MSFVIIPKKDPKKLQNLWAPSLTTVHISLVGWDQGATVGWGPLVGVEFGGGFGVRGRFSKIEFKDHKKGLYRTLEAAPIL